MNRRNVLQLLTAAPVAGACIAAAATVQSAPAPLDMTGYWRIYGGRLCWRDEAGLVHVREGTPEELAAVPNREPPVVLRRWSP